MRAKMVKTERERFLLLRVALVRDCRCRLKRVAGKGEEKRETEKVV